MKKQNHCNATNNKFETISIVYKFVIFNNSNLEKLNNQASKQHHWWPVMLKTNIINMPSLIRKFPDYTLTFASTSTNPLLCALPMHTERYARRYTNKEGIITASLF